MSICFEFRIEKKKEKKRYSELWITKFHACNRCVRVIKFQISVKSKLGNVCMVDSKLVCAISLSKCWFRTSVTSLEGRYKVNARLHRRYIMCFNGTEPHNDSRIFTSWGNNSISIPIPVFAYQIYTLTSDNFGYFNRNDSITKILRRLIFLSFLPRKGEQDLFLFKISVFFFFLISPIFLRWREKNKNSKNFQSIICAD